MPNGKSDLIDELTRDHNKVKALLEQLPAIPDQVMGGLGGADVGASPPWT